MNIEDWWPNLSASARQWLIANNGDVVSPVILDEIAEAGGVVDSEADWIGESGPEGFFLSDSAIDWIEAAANDEA